MRCATALLLVFTPATHSFTVQSTSLLHRPATAFATWRVTHPPVLVEYSTKVKITAETRAPLRQARIFFLYPSIVAGASIAAYVSLLRVIGQEDKLADLGNLGVNGGVITAAIFFLKKDLDGRAALLQQVAVELGEATNPETAEDGGK